MYYVHESKSRCNAFWRIGLCLLLIGTCGQSLGARIKDLAEIEGVRSNQLLGYGLVVGLDGSGDKDNAAPYTIQSLRSMLTQLGIVVPPGIQLKPKMWRRSAFTPSFLPLPRTVSASM